MKQLLFPAALAVFIACGDQSSPTEPRSAGSSPGVQAAGGRPSDAEQTFEVPAGVFCAFPMRFHLTGKAKTIELPGNRVIFTSPGLRVELTNLTNGKQASFGITGAFHQSTLANGNVVTVATGRNLLFDPIAGLVLTIGNFSFVFDHDNNLVQPLQGTGRMIDACALT